MFTTTDYFNMISKIFCIMENKKDFTTRRIFKLKPFSGIKMDVFFQDFHCFSFQCFREKVTPLLLKVFRFFSLILSSFRSVW